jgi:hypothetical protein
MVYRKTLVPDKENHSIEMPEQFFGRKVEVIVMDVTANTAADKSPTPPTGKTVSVNDLFKDFGTAPDFPSIEEIRTKSWPSKW